MNRFTEIVWNCIDFVGKYKRYFAAGCVGVFMVFLLAYGTDNSAADANPLTGAYQSYSEEDTDSDIVKLLNDYYTAYANNDIDALEEVASPVSDKEKSYIAFLSDAIDSYDVGQVYTKRGVDENAYLVSAEIAIHFRTLKNAAPGLDFFYVVRDADSDELKIDNTYSTFNQQNGEFEMDPTVSSLIAEFEQQSDVVSLQEKVQTEYNELLMTDADFSNFSSNALPESIQAWASNYTAALEEEKAKAAEEEAKKKEEEEKAAEEAKKAAEEEEAKKAAEEAEAAKQANSYQVKAIAKVNVRSEASKNSTALGKAQEGETFTAYSEEGDWTLLKYGDGEGYIKTEFLEKVDTEAADNAAADAGEDTETAADNEAASTAHFSTGQKVTLPTTVNVRASMSQSASKVAVAYAGESVEIVMMYEEGWTKVKYNGKEGYVKTEFLQ